MKAVQCPTLPTLDLRGLVRSADLPSMPAATLRIMRLCASPDATVDQLAEIVSTDPKLTARVLSLANAAEHYRGKNFACIRRACAHIGMRQIRSLALTLHLFSLERNEPGMTFDYARFWRYCLTCATAAKLLANQLNNADPEEAFIAGLLQDLGVLILQRCDPKAYGEIRREKALTNVRLYQTETELLGYNHADVGAAFAAHWELPLAIGNAIRNSHTPDENPLSLLCFLADQTHKAIFDHDAMAETDAVNTLRQALNSDMLILARMQVELPRIAEACKCPEWDNDTVQRLKERIAELM